ncbi:hypothetical protein [Phenylobacterium sp.]|uniref:hypothetical protein n=1 Tax=Phenylobacterium sp. TaxID=1871053 RepID=UPI00356AF5C5
MISAILAAAILLADTTAALQQPAPDAAAKSTATAQTAAQATAAAKKNDPQAMVCHSEPVLGSRLPTKRCRTQGDIATEKLESRQALERSQIITDPGH